jgi:cobalt-zinc-cadmium efflux system outer membrane protein
VRDVAVACWLLLSPWGDRADEGPRALTLAEALAAAEDAPARQAATRRTAAAEAAVDAAGAWPATSLGVGTTTHTAHAVVTASVPLPVFGTIGAARDVARAELSTAKAEASSTALELRHRVATAWIELARAEARADVVERTAGRDEQLAAATKARYEAGDAARFDAVAAEAAARRARGDAVAERTNVAAASAELAALLGWDTAAPLHAEGGLPAPAELPAGPPEPAAHPDVAVPEARAREEAARAALASRERWPTLAIDLEADVDDPTLPGTDVRVGPVLELPLFGRGAEQVEAAEARQRAALAERDAARQEVRGRVAAARARARAAALRARTLEADVLPVQREAASLAHLAWKEGQTGLTTVLEAERALLDAEDARVAALAEAALAAADLTWAVAGPTEPAPAPAETPPAPTPSGPAGPRLGPLAPPTNEPPAGGAP